METVKRPKRGMLCVFITAMSAILMQNTLAADIPLKCLERDWFTLFARKDYDVTSLEIAVTDDDSGLSRILMAVDDWDRREKRNSQLAYIDYLTCEPLFFIRNSEIYQVGMSAMTVYTADITKYKPFETIYQVGKVQDEARVVVTIIENENLYQFSFETPFLAQSNSDREPRARGQLTIFQSRVLLWQHAYGALLIDLDLKIAKSVHLTTQSTKFTSIATVPSQYRFLNTLSWEKSFSSTDSIWLTSHDFSSLGGTTASPRLKKERKFAINDFVEGTVVADTLDDTVGLCFIDSQLKLNLALWEASASDTLYRARMNGALRQQTQFEGCASVELDFNNSGQQTLTALLYTNDGQFALLSQTIDYQAKKSANSGIEFSAFVPYTLSYQKFYEFRDLTSLRFSAQNDFIAVRSNVLGGKSVDTWGFILFTDNSNQRRTRLWQASRSYQNSSIDRIQGSAATSNAYADRVVALSGNEGTTQPLWQQAQPFSYNDWIKYLCEQPNYVTRLGANFSLNYPQREQFELKYGNLIDTDYDRRNNWLNTCFPKINFDLPTALQSQISLVSVDKNSKRLKIEVEGVPQASTYIQRGTLFGQGQRFFEQYKYGMKLSEQLASKYKVGFVNYPPEITDPAPKNNKIFVSIQWAPNTLYDRRSLIQDLDGNNRDLLWESGPIIDKENDKILLKMPVLTFIFNVELTPENKVRITMARQMQVKYTGIHRFVFELQDDSQLKPKSTYEVVIVLALYDADPSKQKDSLKPIDLGIDFKEIDESQILPPAPEIESTSDWWRRIPYNERKAQINVQAVSTDGRIHVAFTKPVDFPDKILQMIDEFRLINVTFVPKTYDFIDEVEGKTELAEWKIDRISNYGMDLRVIFADPNMIGYSIYESDQLFIDFNLTGVLDDNSTAEMYGRFVKPIPLQYPSQFDIESRYQFKEFLEHAPEAIITLLVICTSLLAYSISIEQTSIIWQVLGHLQIVVFLPLMNVPVPAQVNDISKSLSNYLRMDIFTYNGQSLMTQMARYVFNFPIQTESMPLHFEQLGFTSRNAFETAFGLNLLHCMIVFPVILILICFFIAKIRFKYFGHAFVKLRAIFYNNFYVRYNLETYFVYSVCNMLTVQDFSFYNWASSLQSIVSGLHLTLLCIIPLFIAVFYTLNYSKLVSNKNFRATWGSLYMGFVGDKESSKTINAIKLPAATTGRMFVFAFSLTVLRDYWILQQSFLFFATAVIIHITCQESINGPYQSKLMNNLQVFMDIIVMILTDFMVAFNGGGFISTDQRMRFSIGWAYSGILSLGIVVALTVLVYITLKVVQRTMLIQQVKLSKNKIRMQRRQSRIAKRQSHKMQTLRAQHLKVQGVDGGEGSSFMDSPLNSPAGQSQIVMQQYDTKQLTVLDQDNLRRGLTEIVEGSSDEEDSSVTSSSNSLVSEISGSESEFYMQGVKPPEYVMGFNLLPKISRQKIIKTRPSTVPPRGTRSNGNSDNLHLGLGGSKRSLMKANLTRNSNSTPPVMPREPKLYNQKRWPNRTLYSDSSADDGEESFKAGSPIRHGKSFENQGNLTSKIIGNSQSFSHQMIEVQGKNSQIDNISMIDPDTERALFSQPNTKRDSRREYKIESKKSSQRKSRHEMESRQSKHHSSKKSQKSGRLNQKYHMQSALSKRSNDSNLSQINDAVSARIEQIVHKKVEERRATFKTNSECEDKADSNKANRKKSQYVMGEQMARDSMMEDMANNIMVLSKINTSTSDLSPMTAPNMSKRKRQQSYYDNNSISAELSNQNLNFYQENKSNSVSLRQQNGPIQVGRLTKKVQSMGLQDQQYRQDLTRMQPTTPPMDEVSEEKESSCNQSKRKQTTVTNEKASVNNFTDADIVVNSPASGAMLLEQSRRLLAEKNRDDDDDGDDFNEVEVVAEGNQVVKQEFESSAEREKESNSKRSQKYKERVAEPRHVVHSMDEFEPAIALTSAKSLVSSLKSSYSNKELGQIVDQENKKYKKQQNNSGQRLPSSGIKSSQQDTPQFVADRVMPNYNHSLSLQSKNSSRQMMATNPQSLQGSMAMSQHPMLAKLNSEGSNEDPSLDRRHSSVSRSRPVDMPILNLDQDNLLAGINQRVARHNLKQQPQRTLSMTSELSDMSKFDVDDKMSSMSPDRRNVRFAP